MLTSETALTRTAKASRKTIKVVVLGFVLFIALRFAINSFASLWRSLNPPPPPPPTVGYGVLPAIHFPEVPASQQLPTEYQLETPTGTFPQFSDRAVVYLMPKNPPSLLDHEHALQTAAQLGFIFEPTILNSRTYRFTITDPLVTTLDLDLQEGTYLLQSDYLNRPDLLLQTEVPTKFDAVSEVKKFLSLSDSLPESVATVSGEVAYLKASGTSLVTAVSPSDAQYVEVNLNRPPVVGKYSMYTAEGEKGSIRAILAPLKGKKDNIVFMQNAFNPIDESRFETYPIRPVRDAWNALQNGGGFIPPSVSAQKVVVRSVELGYFEDLEGQEYLQPIYVFKGDNGFIGYVPALSSAYVDASQTSTTTGTP